MPVTKAKLMRVILPKKKTDKAQPLSDTEMEVQFNPETLTVSYSNQIAGDKQKGGSTQLAASGTTKLAMDLWFDTTVPQNVEAGQLDVRQLTRKVAAMMEPPEQKPAGAVAGELPAVRFHWGNFIFDGVMDALTEKLEYFSADGVPLRASLSVSLSAQVLLIQAAAGAGGTGTQPLQQATGGEPLSQMAAKQGIDDWKSIAEANGIENARRMQDGQKIDMSKGAN